MLHAGEFNIQIDNLCQFLPQDKVVEFAQMSPTELLLSTQQAVAGKDLIKLHEDLKRVRSNQVEFTRENKGSREHLANLENRQAMQQTEVERMKKRAKVKLRLERLEQSRKMLEYQAAKRIADEARSRSKALTQELKALKTASAPTLAKLRSKERYETEARGSKSSCNEELNNKVRICEAKAKAITKIDEDMNGLIGQIETEKDNAKQTKATLSREQVKLRDLKRKKAENPGNFDVTGITNEMQELRARANALSSQIHELEPRKADLKDRGLKRKQDMDSLNAKIESFGSHANQQEDKLKSISKDTWQAWDWIQKNQDQFSQHVYGPPIVECSLKDPNVAEAVESLLQQSDFKFITAQNKADFSRLQERLFREMRLHDVSLRECATESLDQFRPPITQGDMSKYGLSSWALDHLQGPTTILAQLCHEKSLHRCGITAKELTQQQHDELAKSDVQSYVGGKKVYHFLKRKEYGAAGISTRVQDVRRAAMWTNQPVDLGRKAALSRELNEARGEASMLHAEFKEIHKQIKDLETTRNQITTEVDAKKSAKDAIQRSKLEYDALDGKITTTEEKIDTLKAQLYGVGAVVGRIQDQLDELLINKTEAVIEFASATRDVKMKTASMLEADVVLIEAVSDLQVAKAQNDEIVQSIAQKEAEQAEAQDLARKQQEIARNVRDDAIKVFDEGKRLEREGDSSFAELLEHVIHQLKTPESLDAEIDSAKANLELTEGGNAGIITEFERRAKEIEILRAKVQDADKEQEEFKHAIEQVRRRWEPQLEQVVAKINEAFSDSFARIGCAGQVAVYKASSVDPVDCTEENGGEENGLDFANWAIHISVKFREQEPLSLLDSHRQSGGERAVSTIFYLMALQSLSKAPFRVVDEINQGMDPRNERMVHGRMVDIAADDDGGSQYFLITPKLLSGLKYRRGMTVLCIVSGENVPAARARDGAGRWHDGPKINFRAFANKARQLGIAGPGGATGKRIDSAIGMGTGTSFGSASQSTSVGA